MILEKQESVKEMFVAPPSNVRETLSMKLDRQKNEQLVLALVQHRVKEAQEACILWDEKGKNGMDVPKMYQGGFAAHMAKQEQKYIESMVWALENGTEEQKLEARKALNKYAQEHAEELKKEQENASKSNTFGSLIKGEDGTSKTPIQADKSGQLKYILPDGTTYSSNTKEGKEQNKTQQLKNMKPGCDNMSLKEILRLAMVGVDHTELPTKLMVMKNKTR